MRAMFARADFHIQTEPIVDVVDCDFTSEVVSRKPRRTRAETRTALGLDPEERVVLVSGGIPPDGGLAERLEAMCDVRVVVTGLGDTIATRSGLVCLPYASGFYHPDLVAASDAVVGKLGYSTVAEVYHAGVPYAYIARERFRESTSLEAFVQSEMPCRRIAPREYLEGEWVSGLPELAALPAMARDIANGADQIAEFLDSTVLADAG
jgi:hypothetical protein